MYENDGSEICIFCGTLLDSKDQPEKICSIFLRGFGIFLFAFSRRSSLEIIPKKRCASSDHFHRPIQPIFHGNVFLEITIKKLFLNVLYFSAEGGNGQIDTHLRYKDDLNVRQGCRLPKISE